MKRLAFNILSILLIPILLGAASHWVYKKHICLVEAQDDACCELKAPSTKSCCESHKPESLAENEDESCPNEADCCQILIHTIVNKFLS